MRVAFDCEGDNLHPYLSKIYCVSVVDLDTGAVATHTKPSELQWAMRRWTLACGHNSLGFDLWALRKCWGIDFTVGPDTLQGQPIEFVDTLVWSRTLHPDRPWGHSLAAWGEHLGIPKFDHTDFTQYTEEMKVYCEQDARICAAIYKELLRELDK